MLSLLSLLENPLIFLLVSWGLLVLTLTGYELYRSNRKCRRSPTRKGYFLLNTQDYENQLKDSEHFSRELKQKD